MSSPYRTVSSSLNATNNNTSYNSNINKRISSNTIISNSKPVSASPTEIKIVSAPDEENYLEEVKTAMDMEMNNLMQIVNNYSMEAASMIESSNNQLAEMTALKMNLETKSSAIQNLVCVVAGVYSHQDANQNQTSASSFEGYEDQFEEAT